MQDVYHQPKVYRWSALGPEKASQALSCPEQAPKPLNPKPLDPQTLNPKPQASG